MFRLHNSLQTSCHLFLKGLEVDYSGRLGGVKASMCLQANIFVSKANYTHFFKILLQVWISLSCCCMEIGKYIKLDAKVLISPPSVIT